MLYHTFSKKTVSYSYRKSIIPPVLLPSLNQFGSESSHRAEFLNEIPIQIYEKVSQETLENLCETIDHLLEEKYPSEFDVSLSNGVLTIQLGQHGTYVINKQTPNRQIWLSSPTSGPKRYDYINRHWVYSHDKTNLDELLNKEFSYILNEYVAIVSLPFCES
ncbi:hypothetical protein DAPPUDRAFT_333409 [Daphnia pulex]|uniref:ferroxidase n=1 Tax=Daphnia pulex TaxID=6669 RepID=E9HSR0_DAPPU|nr:hypothetical protein DAPPUDRAFT_333409 [Daphnia pulex]|eukprot:EFX65222.1 hypothetical protein DAPPUDRAFT_333409 [Daphnia pulex]